MMQANPAATRRTLACRLDTPLACLLVLVIALCAFTVGQLARVRFDPSAFIVAGDRYSHAREVPPGITVLDRSDGYDGQFYYRLSLDPFTSKPTDFGITFDNPPYRQQRFLYPFIVHVVTLADAKSVPIAMIATNFFFFGLMAWIAGRLAQTFDRHALWGLLVVACPGFLVSYSRDLVEIVEATFLLGSVLLLRRGKPGWATASLTLAIWTRETSLIVAVAAALVLAMDRLRGRPEREFGWTHVTVPIVAFCALQGALYLNWGEAPVHAGSGVMGHGLLAGFGNSLPRAAAVSRIDWIHQLVAVAFVVVCSAGVLLHLFVTKADPSVKMACLLFALLLLSVGESVWAEDIAFLRVFAQFYVFGAIVVIASPPNPVGLGLALFIGATWMFELYRLGSVGPIAHLLRHSLGGA